MPPAPLRVIYVAGSFPPAREYGGTTESGYRLCQALQARGVAVRVLAINADRERRLPVEANRWTRFDGIPVYYANRLGASLIAPRLYLDPAIGWADTDLVHLSGGFSALVPVVALRAQLQGLRVVFSPRGMFTPQALGKSAGRKTLFNRVVGRLAYPRFAAWHVTSDDEAESARPWAGSARIEVIPNGVVLPAARERPRPDPPYLLFLGRLHPFKQIEAIVDGFAVGAGGSSAELWIAGDGEPGYVEELRRFVAQHPAAARVRFVGYAEGEAKSALLAGATGLVLGSKSENFGLSVAEALAHGTPCVVTKTAPWAGLEAERCGYWVEASTSGLASGIRALLALPEAERRVMGERGRAWMERDFSWDGVARRMVALYEAVIRI